jgi:leader peptidase (prepilin peptidase)/N-methyltransferase
MTATAVLGWILIFFLGAAIGSFLNVVIYRLPRGRSLLRPPSHCTSCGKRLGALEMIPILSWLWLRGRCRRCGHAISPRYPAVELASALLACASVYFWGLGVAAVCVYAVCAALLVTFFVDLDHMIIPDQVHFVIAAAGILLDLRCLWLRGLAGMVTLTEQVGARPLTMAWPRSLAGAAVGGGLFLLIAYLAQLVFRRPALGLGDVKLAAALGTVLGPGYYFLAFFLLAVLLGAAVGIIVLAATGWRRGRYMPFGPMLAVAGILVTLAPEQVASLVLHPFLV